VSPLGFWRAERVDGAARHDGTSLATPSMVASFLLTAPLQT